MDKEKVEEKIVEKAVLAEGEIVDVETAVPEPIKIGGVDIEAWKPKTKLGKMVRNREITDIDQILDKGERIMEAEISEALLQNIEVDLLMIGQSKGKFGGGKRRIFKQTQKKTREGNKPKFNAMAVAGNQDGYIGIGYGKSKETVPAREKAIRNSKLNIIKIARGCGSWQCNCRLPHSIPFKVEGKCGSIRITLWPAPRGTGLKVSSECQKVLRSAGIKDVWSRMDGQTRSTVNVIYALEDAIRKLLSTKMKHEYKEKLGIKEGSVKKTIEA